MPNLSITIAICTWNRATSLHNTLTSLQKMEVPADIEWEVLVINNNCTDDTDAVIASFADTLPIRSLVETQQGLSHARNCAVEAARGKYLLWTDDDVLVDPGWLAAYSDAFRTWPDAALFGGPIVPKFQAKPPAWLLLALPKGNIADVYAARDFGVEPCHLEMEGNKIPYGANFAVRMQEQRKFAFDPRLGAHKDDNVRGEETEVIKKILGSGASGRWVPNAQVHHVIPKHRQSKSYIRNYFVGRGRTIVRQNPAENSTTFLGAPRWLWRKALSARSRYYLKRLVASPEIWCHELRQSSMLWGQLLEYRAIKRDLK